MRHAKLTEFEVHSGALVDLLDPQAEDVKIADVAISLAKTNRYAGHVKGHYSVAQHSIYVASLLPEEHRIHGLLHDAPEYGMGDMINPMKRALSAIIPDFRRAWRHIEAGLLRTIYEVAGVALPSPEVVEMVKRADLALLAAEQRDVMRSPNLWNIPVPAPIDLRIRPVDVGPALAMYVDALEECGVKVGRLPVLV